MKITKTLRLDHDDNNNWEGLAYDTLRDALRSNLHIETIHINGSEVFLEGTHSPHHEMDIL